MLQSTYVLYAKPFDFHIALVIKLEMIAHTWRVYALPREDSLLTRVARKRRGLVPEC